MSLFNKYVESFREAEKTILGIPSIPRGMVKILMSLKALTDLVDVLFILVILIVAIG